MKKSYIAFGSNVGSRQKNVEIALRKLASSDGITHFRVSPLYETDPVGGPKQNSYYNGVVEVSTTLSPQRLLKTLRDLEAQGGRVRHTRWGPRTLDLDILIYGNSILHSKTLTIPHPRYHMRRFVLVPFVRLAPNFIHPIIRKKNKSLLRELTVGGQRVTMLGPWKKSRFQFSKIGKKKKNQS